MKHKAAFLDRDGVINEDFGYVHRVDDFVIIPGAWEGMRALQSMGFKLVVITNQAGVAKGYYDVGDVEIVHHHLTAVALSKGVELSNIYFCPHHPRGVVAELSIDCECRKPNPGMLRKASSELNLDLGRSVMIGDKISDIRAGKNAGVSHSIIVNSGHAVGDSASREADAFVRDLASAARYIARLQATRPGNGITDAGDGSVN